MTQSSVSLPVFANVDPENLGFATIVRCLLGGEWINPNSMEEIPDPLHGGTLYRLGVTDSSELYAFAASLRECPSYGLHNPKYNVERYVLLGEVFRQVGNALLDPTVAAFFTRLIQRCMPKSTAQCAAEVKVTGLGYVNFGGDNVRQLARGFTLSGDRGGQESRGYRWPFGPVMIICPFNFPLEIPALQVLGALAMGNKVLLKCDSRVAIVMEQFVRLLIACGLPATDIDLMHADGPTTGHFIQEYAELIRLLQFTGSSRVAEELAVKLRGRVRVEDAGFDWKILGQDVDRCWIPFVAYTCDQDAFAASGQKCSAQSLLFMHANWRSVHLLSQLELRAATRRLDNLTIGPVLTWTTQQLLDHVQQLCAIPGAKLAFGGKALTGHTIPACYGAIEPTAVLVPLSALRDNSLFPLITREVFGPVQVIVEYSDDDLDIVLSVCERLQQRLTAAVVSASPLFINRVLGATTNGTTYVGMMARTTGAPQNHWFGPASDPRAAGIGTREAIIGTWSCHREIIQDDGPLPPNWMVPDAT